MISVSLLAWVGWAAFLTLGLVTAPFVFGSKELPPKRELQGGGDVCEFAWWPEAHLRKRGIKANLGNPFFDWAVDRGHLGCEVFEGIYTTRNLGSRRVEGAWLPEHPGT